MHPAIQKRFALISKILQSVEGHGIQDVGPGYAHLRARLDKISAVFMRSCTLALEADQVDDMVAELNAVESDLRGFAYEGAGMGLLLFDYLTGGKYERLNQFMNGAGASYRLLLLVGAGCGLARLRLPVRPTIAKFDDVMAWSICDGYGFHEGYFWPQYLQKQALPKHCTDFALKVFDHGLGRAIWFTHSAAAFAMRERIQTFHPTRHPDLWKGLGMACGYAGALSRPALAQLVEASAEHVSQVAAGLAIAAQTRADANNMAPHTEIACQAIWEKPAQEVANLSRSIASSVSASSAEARYEAWRGQLVTAHASQRGVRERSVNGPTQQVSPEVS